LSSSPRIRGGAAVRLDFQQLLAQQRVLAGQLLP